MFHKTDTEIIIPLNNLSPEDIQWIERRLSMPLSSVRIVADLQQLAIEIKNLDTQHNDTISKIRECVGVPKHISFIK